MKLPSVSKTSTWKNSRKFLATWKLKITLTVTNKLTLQSKKLNELYLSYEMSFKQMYKNIFYLLQYLKLMKINQFIKLAQRQIVVVTDLYLF